MVPSSLTISASTPAGVSPASRARSTAASVWPRRRSTPPGVYRSGNTWPGRTISYGSVAESTSVRMVRARSAAEIPVVTPSRASTLIVYAVRIRSVFWLSSAAAGAGPASRPASGTQITPLVCRIVKVSSSGVALLAAKMMSPSFSRSASSTTTRPGRRRCRRPPARRRPGELPVTRRLGGHGVLPASSRSTYLAIMSTSRLTTSPAACAERGAGQGLRDQADLEPGLRGRVGALSAETVRLTPSTATEPFWTT